MKFVNFLIMLFMLIMLLISITFLTLLEQKVLSYIQIRKGPNVVGYLGLFQPFADALKLFMMEITKPIYSNYLIYYFTPSLSLSTSLVLWLVFPYNINCIFYIFSFLFIFSVMSLGVYFIMISGWSSNSNYSLLGSLRSIAQTISYEVCMIFMFLYFIIYICSFSIMKFMNYQNNFSFIFLNLLLSMIMFVVFLAETNRAPFDFAEGESELVSGFNTEYSSGNFALIFLSEYSMILFLSLIFVFIFVFNSFLYIFFYLKFMFVSFLFIWVRSSYPRYRYDKLMYLSWKFYLVISLMFLILSFMVKLVLIYL